ncbi:uncharacterized protein LOC144448389 [Glandiceps talaboti]
MLQVLTLVCVLLGSGHSTAYGEEDEGTVRLVGGAIPQHGKAEVNVPDIGWLSVCGDDTWERSDADVFCRELGYPDAMFPSVNAVESNATGQQWLTNVACTGNELSILDCVFNITKSCDKNLVARPRCNYKDFLGFYNDNFFNPVLPDHRETDDSMTIQLCLSECLRNNMTYAGLRLVDCVCGRKGIDYSNLGKPDNLIGKVSVCGGDNFQACGGGRTIVAVYPTSMGACGGLITGSGTIYSPGFPGNYTENQDCVWNITTSIGAKIRMEFPLFNLLGKKDYVTISEWKDGEFHPVRNFSESNPPESMYLCSRLIQLIFHSDESDGIFEVNIRDVPPQCSLPSKIVHRTVEVVKKCSRDYAISVSCDSGYSITTDHSVVVCTDKGGWNDTIPNCRGRGLYDVVTDPKAASPTKTSSQLGNTDDSLHIGVGIIAGIAIAGVLVIILVICLTVFICKRRRIAEQKGRRLEMVYMTGYAYAATHGAKETAVDNTYESIPHSGIPLQELPADDPMYTNVGTRQRPSQYRYKSSEYEAIPDMVQSDERSDNYYSIDDVKHSNPRASIISSRKPQTDDANDIPDYGGNAETDKQVPPVYAQVQKKNKSNKNRSSGNSDRGEGNDERSRGQGDGMMVPNIAYESADGWNANDRYNVA